MTTPDWAAVRRDYPVTRRKAYFDTAHRGIPSARTVEAVESYCQLLRTSPAESATADTVGLMATVADTRRAVAELIHADPGEIALVESTQHGLSIAAGLLGLDPGDKVVTDDLEFAGVVLPYRSRGTAGVQIDAVGHRDGAVEVADLADAVDDRTRVVAVSSVQEVNGFRLDLAALRDVCDAHGAYLVVDGIQHVGPLCLDAHGTGADFLAVGAHKWLGSPFGLGFLYVRSGLIDTFEPLFRGHTSIAEPAEGWDAYVSDPNRHPLEDHVFAQTAQKFEVAGTPNFAGAVALGAAVKTLLDLGPRAVEERVRQITSLLVQGLDELGVELVTPRDPAGRGGIVTFRGADDVEGERQLLRALLDAGVSVSLRYVSGLGGIRVAPYVYNDESDVDRLLDVVSRRRRGRRRSG